ncbi:transferase family-domain-containing protein [Whalleya microplaca]|nr:transferase family-domain-containing protein [Whalleya microplaca]
MANHPDLTYLSPLDKIMPRAYVGQMLCFPSTNPRVSQVLKDGLAGVVADIPYLLSGVVTSSDRSSISLSEPYQSLEDLFSEVDLTDSVVYASMKAAHFPPSAFTLDGMKPPDTLPPYPNPAPVFRARLSLVNGGFVLFVAFHHSTTDITGFGSLLRIWASHCRTGSSAAAGFDPAWLDRKALFDPPEAKTEPVPLPENLHIREPSALSKLGSGGSPAHIGNLKTAIFFFPQRGLRRLKDAVNEHITSSQGAGTWVSTSDILTVLLWSSILAAEAPEPNPPPSPGPKHTTTLGFPANFRSRLTPPLPPHYLGAAFINTSATAPREDLLSLSTPPSPSTDPPHGPLDPASVSRIAHLATLIRASLSRIDDASVRAALAYLHAQPADHAPVVLGARDDGISVVSWADEGVYELGWGEVVGRCEKVRVPTLGFKRNPIVLPRVPAGRYGDGDGDCGGGGDDEGGLEVIMCFDGRIVESMERNLLVRRFAVLRCCS